MLKVSYSKVLKFFLKNGPEVIICEVFIIIYVNLSCYIFFKVVLCVILSINSVPKSRDFLSLFRVYSIIGIGVYRYYRYKSKGIEVRG